MHLYRVLIHHGILGQKWGKRNGPPYPLGASDHSAYEKKMGYTKSLGGNTNENLYKRLAGSSSSTESTNSDGNSNSKRPKKNGSSSNVDSATGFHKLSHSESSEDRLARCNPNFVKTNYISPYNRNCGNTVIANELRRRGLDVEARGNNYGLTVNNMKDFFNGTEENSTEIIPKARNLKGITVKTMLFGKKVTNPKVQEKIKNDLIERGKQIQKQYEDAIAKKYPEGSSGCMQITSLTGAHWISWEIKNGKVNFENPQDPKENLLMDFGAHGNFGKNGPKPTAIRLDNLSTNNKNINNVVMNYGGNADKHGMSFNPLEKGIDFTKVNKQLFEQQVNRYYGPKWDGSWKAFDNIKNKTLNEL